MGAAAAGGKTVPARVRAPATALRPLLPAAEAERTARSLSALIDGLWLRSGLGGASARAEDALAEAMLLVERAIPRKAGPRRA